MLKRNFSNFGKESVSEQKKCFKQNDWGFTGLLTLGALKLLYGGSAKAKYVRKFGCKVLRLAFQITYLSSKI